MQIAQFFCDKCRMLVVDTRRSGSRSKSLNARDEILCVHGTGRPQQNAPDLIVTTFSKFHRKYGLRVGAPGVVLPRDVRSGADWQSGVLETENYAYVN